jgi:hypothetical protein
MSETSFLTNCKNLLKSISKDDLPIVVSQLDVINCSCKIVEEVYLRMKSNRNLNVAISGPTKKITASELFQPLIKKYFDFQLISQPERDEYMATCIPETVDALIDSLISIWKKEGGLKEEDIRRGIKALLTCFSLWARKQTTDRPFINVKILENVEVIPE